MKTLSFVSRPALVLATVALLALATGCSTPPKAPENPNPHQRTASDGKTMVRRNPNPRQ